MLITANPLAKYAAMCRVQCAGRETQHQSLGIANCAPPQMSWRTPKTQAFGWAGARRVMSLCNRMDENTKFDACQQLDEPGR
jgi:hypothetical protein